MHLISFDEGRPMVVHQFKKPTYPVHFIWQPPVRDRPYIFKAGNCREPIYGFMFTLTSVDRDEMSGNYRWSDHTPKRLKPVLKLLELLFTKNSKDYAVELRDLYSLFPDDVFLVTDQGVRGKTSLSYRDIACKSDILITSNPVAAKPFLNMVNHNIKHLKKTRQEAFDLALETQIYGEFYYAQTPDWWLEAFNHYGTTVKE